MGGGRHEVGRGLSEKRREIQPGSPSNELHLKKWVGEPDRTASNEISCPQVKQEENEKRHGTPLAGSPVKQAFRIRWGN